MFLFEISANIAEYANTLFFEILRIFAYVTQSVRAVICAVRFYVSGGNFCHQPVVVWGEMPQNGVTFQSC
jgi:hypothetical protein